MNVHFLNTFVLGYNHYIDLLLINGVPKTFLMHKIEEPNVFGVLKEEDGFNLPAIANYIKENNVPIY